MQTLRIAKVVSPALLLIVLATPCVAVDKLPSFDQIYTSNDKYDLTAWGLRYARGVGVAKDAQKAIKLFCKAARKGDTEAKLKLGQIYAFGQGVERDWELGNAWLYEAAKDKSSAADSMIEIFNMREKPNRVASCPEDATDVIVDIRIANHSSHPASGPIADMVRAMAPKYRLDPNLVLAVVETESGFNPKALSPKNAQGLMQLIPETAARFGVKNVWDPEQNLKGGMAYLRWLLDYFNGDVKLALAGYNAGERAVDRYGGVPPYAETQAYVKRIIKRIGGGQSDQGGQSGQG